MKYLPLLFFALLLANCRPSENSCVAGTGGHVNIVAYANHNGSGLLNYALHPYTAFIKFNTLASPGTDPSKYDTFFVGETGEDHIHCENLKCGSYYIYRIAFDSASNTRYTGGLGISFTETAGEIDTAITVY